jgi:hypothetical protein
LRTKSLFVCLVALLSITLVACIPDIKIPEIKSPEIKSPDILPIESYTLDFTVEVPENTPKHAVIFIELYDDDGNQRNAFEMEKIGANTWHYKNRFESFKNTQLKYLYTRGNWAFTGAEEFSPDSKTTFRTVLVEEGPKEINETIEKWRWLPEQSYKMPTIPTEAGKITFSPRINGEEFQKGALFADFWWDIFEDLLDSTHTRLKENNFEWIEIAAPWDYKQVNPVPIITYEGFGHTYDEEEIDLHLKRTKADGFKIFLAPQICCVDTSRASFSDEWWNAWFAQYENYVLYFADLASKYDVDALAISGDWIALEQKPSNYKQRLEAIYSKVRQHYNGKLGRSIYMQGTIDNIEDLWPQISSTPFMDEWDFFAVSMWIGMTTKNSPTQEELNSNVKTIFEARLKPLYDAYEKPIVLGQVAYASVDGGLKGKIGVFEPEIQLWNSYSDEYTLDLEEQAMGYEAIMKNVAETPYIVGLYPFTYWPDAFPLSKEYNIRDKPAEEVLRQWYESIE